MNIVKCTNGHFYDSDKYPSCPHCGAPKGTSVTEKTPEVDNEKKKRFGIFNHKSRSPKTNESNSAPIHYDSNYDNSTVGLEQGTINDGSDETMDMMESRNYGRSNASSGKTLDVWSASQDDPNDFDRSREEEIRFDPQDRLFGQENDDDRESAEEKQEGSLREMVRRATASSEGKTMSYFSALSMKNNSAQEKEQKQQTDPVVGWIVCVSGCHFGESFVIAAGMNSIGRNDSNSIIINQDNSISRERHAYITYEPKNRVFYLKPGDSSGLTYLNGEYISETSRLKAMDSIELGNGKYVFIPLCGPDFSWEEYLNMR